MGAEVKCKDCGDIWYRMGGPMEAACAGCGSERVVIKLPRKRKY